MSPHPRRDAMALLACVLVLLGLGTVSAALLYVGLQESRISRAGADVLRARLAAESAVRIALAMWDTREFRDMAPAEVRALDAASPAAADRIVVERLAGSLYRIRAQATAPSGARARAGIVIRTLDIAELWRPFGAAITLRGDLRVDAQADVVGLDYGDFAAQWTPDDCPAAAFTDLVRTFGRADLPATRVPDSVAATEPGATRIGPLAPTTLADIADHVVTGDLTPAPAYDTGRCDTGVPANWGAPLAPDDPCGHFFPLVFAPGDLHVSGGAAQGVLIVAGDLTIDDGARFYGPVVVAGRVTIRDTSTIRGALIGSGDVAVHDQARITYDPCAIWRALARAPALNRPFRSGPRFWVPAF
ncbi:MAG TPA: polymer-forming cytoskeletal protein [Longimicrobiales bacterium]